MGNLARRMRRQRAHRIGGNIRVCTPDSDLLACPVHGRQHARLMRALPTLERQGWSAAQALEEVAFLEARHRGLPVRQDRAQSVAP